MITPGCAMGMLWLFTAVWFLVAIHDIQTKEIQAYGQLCETAHRMSKEHKLLCEIHGTLGHIRRTSNELLYTAQQTHKALQKQLSGSSSSALQEQHLEHTEESAPNDEHKANGSPTMKRSNSGRSPHPDMHPENTRVAIRFNKSDSSITHA